MRATDETKNIFPDLTRMRLETRLLSARSIDEQELCAALITLYDRGSIEVRSDPFTGDLLYQAAVLN